MTKFVSFGDLFEGFAFTSAAPMAFALPSNQMPKLAKRLASILIHSTKPTRSAVGSYSSIVGSRGGQVRMAEVYRKAVEYVVLERLYLLQCYRWGGWDPKIHVTGREHVSGALERGQGAILWVMPFRFSDLVTKMALAREGFDVEHLSRYNHPGSDSTIGCALLNPIRTKVEDRYLAQRITIGRDNRVDGGKPLDVLATRLQENRIVSVTVGHNARQTVTVPLLDGQLALATGPAHLSLKSAAPLLPVFTICRSVGEFEVTIGPELAVSSTYDGNDRIEPMLRDFTDRLGHFLLRWPEQFPWSRVRSLPRRIELPHREESLID